MRFHILRSALAHCYYELWRNSKIFYEHLLVITMSRERWIIFLSHGNMWQCGTDIEDDWDSGEKSSGTVKLLQPRLMSCCAMDLMWIGEWHDLIDGIKLVSSSMWMRDDSDSVILYIARTMNFAFTDLYTKRTEVQWFEQHKLYNRIRCNVYSLV